MLKPIVALVLGAFAAALALACGTTPTAPGAVAQSALSGTWTGSGSDSQGDELMTWVLRQTETSVTGSVVTQALDPADGSCASCHKSKVGTLSGTVAGTVLMLRIYFPTGGDVPTPLCSVTMDAIVLDITSGRLASSYSGGDTCEGPFSDGVFAMNRQP